MNRIRKLETPCFVIEKTVIDSLINELKEALNDKFDKHIIGYSFKTNNVPFVIEYMKNKGLYAEVVSSSEYQLAKSLGYDIDKIIFNGPVKGKKDFCEAVENGAIVNIDSKRELEWILNCTKEKLDKAKIGLRVNFCLEDYCEGESQTGSEDGRFGFSYESGELKEALDFLKNNDIRLSGLHVHCSSKTRSLKIYTSIASIVCKIIEEYKLDLNYIDIGGGFFGGLKNKPRFNDYFSEVFNILNEKINTQEITLIVEPGMSIIGAGLNYVTKVADVKKTKNNVFVTLDGSRIHVDPLMRKSSYDFEVIRERQSNPIEQQILCGFTCMENDRFFSITDHLLQNDDIVIFYKVGAYTIGLAPQFIEFHPNIYFNHENEYKLIQVKKSAKDFIGRREN